MGNKLIVALNLLLISIVFYSYFLLESYNAEVQSLKAEIIENSQAKSLFDRLSHVDQAVIKDLPLTQIQNGTVTFSAKTHPSAINPDGCESNRGLFQHKVLFDKAFVDVPKMSFGITGMDFRDGVDHRLKIETTELTKFGFTINLVTWCDTKVSFAEADWIAYYLP